MPTEWLEIPYKYHPGVVRVAQGVIRPQDQIFNHRDLAGVWRSFHVLSLIQVINAPGSDIDQVEIDLVPEDVEYIRRNHGVEARHLARISLTDLETPGILCALPDKHDILVDGNHRYVARYGLGLTKMRFYRPTEAQCRPAMLALPPAMLEASLPG